MFLVIHKIAKIRTSSFFLKKKIISRLTFKTFGLKDFETRDNARTKKRVIMKGMKLKLTVL